MAGTDEQKQQDPANVDAQGKSTPTGDAPGAGDAKQQNSGDVQFTPEQQTRLEAILKERLQRAKEKWESDSATAKKKADEDAETQRLASEKEFEKLANKRQARIEELEGQLKAAGEAQTKLEQYEKVLQAYVERERKGLPKHVTDLLDRLDVAEQLEWIAKNKDALTQQQGAGGGVPPTPKGDGRDNSKLTPEQRRERSWQPRSL